MMGKVLRYSATFVAGAVAALLLTAQPDLREQLMQADRDFDTATARNGADGWASYFAEDGKMYGADGNLLTGRPAIRELMAPLFGNPKNSLRWEPTFAAVSRSGDLGYTTGKSKRRSLDTDGQMTERDGRYLTIWRKQQDGSWKVEIDVGNSGPPRPVQ
jgi:uncharacterized protein (TIGR02246 family)